MKLFPAFPADVATVKSTKSAAVRSIVLDAAVFVSLYTESATEDTAPISIASGPCTSNAPLVPVVDVAAFRLMFQGLFVAATVAAVVIEAKVTTVPDPHPDTVHSFALKVSAGVCNVAMVKMPDP